MSDTMPLLGATLRQAREAAGLTREDLAQELNLSMRHLEAIEGDAWDLMPPGRARPLARQVAERLRVDLDAQVEAFQTVPGIPEEEPLDPKRDRLERMAMMGVGAGSVLLVLWLVVPGPRLGKKLVSDRPGLLAGQALPSPPPPTQAPYPVLGELIPEAPLNAEGILVSVRALDACNARIESQAEGGGPPQDHALRVSEPWRLRVKGPFTLTLDNAGVVNLEVAGRRVHHGQSVGQGWVGRFDAEGRWLRPVEPEVPDTPPTDDQEE